MKKQKRQYSIESRYFYFIGLRKTRIITSSSYTPNIFTPSRVEFYFWHYENLISSTLPYEYNEHLVLISTIFCHPHNVFLCTSQFPNAPIVLGYAAYTCLYHHQQKRNLWTDEKWLAAATIAASGEEDVTVVALLDVSVSAVAWKSEENNFMKDVHHISLLILKWILKIQKSLWILKESRTCVRQIIGYFKTSEDCARFGFVRF